MSIFIKKVKLNEGGDKYNPCHEGEDNERNASHSARELNVKQKADPESSEESTRSSFSSPCLLSEFEDDERR